MSAPGSRCATAATAPFSRPFAVAAALAVALGFLRAAFGARLPDVSFRLPVFGFRFAADRFRLPAFALRRAAAGGRRPAPGFLFAVLLPVFFFTWPPAALYAKPGTGGMFTCSGRTAFPVTR